MHDYADLHVFLLFSLWSLYFIHFHYWCSASVYFYTIWTFICHLCTLDKCHRIAFAYMASLICFCHSPCFLWSSPQPYECPLLSCVTQSWRQYSKINGARPGLKNHAQVLGNASANTTSSVIGGGCGMHHISNVSFGGGGSLTLRLTLETD